jgi:signal peptidase I
MNPFWKDEEEMAVRHLSKALSWMLYATVVVLMIFALFANFLIIAQALFSPLDVVQGNSMNPTIEEEDAVYVTQADPENLSVGDIVIFDDPEDYHQSIVHRIVGFVEEDGIEYAVTKGDANAVVDPFLLPVNSVDGKVGMILPKAGVFLSYLRSYPGFIACVICPLCLLVLYLLAKCHLEKNANGKSLFSRALIPTN